jgi:hypothetical protein
LTNSVFGHDPVGSRVRPSSAARYYFTDGSLISKASM